MIIITLRQYEQAALRTASMSLSLEDRIGVFNLGLGGETGEVLDILKKHIGHDHDLDLNKLNKEIGDSLWYIAVLGDALGIHMSTLVPVSDLDDIYQAIQPHDLESQGNKKVLSLCRRLSKHVGLASEGIDNLVAGHVDMHFVKVHLSKVLWYLTFIANHYGLKMSDIATRNNQKLLERYPAGFNSEASKNRKAED